MKQTIFKGSGVAIITPMLEDGSVNYPVLKELLEQQIAGGTDAIVICGTTGEASALNDTEHLDVIEFACATVNRRLPVIAGTGSNDTRHAVALSREESHASPRSVLPGVVAGIDVDGSLVSVRVALAVGVSVTARVTASAWADLGLGVGDTLWASVKATQVRAIRVAAGS